MKIRFIPLPSGGYEVVRDGVSIGTVHKRTEDRQEQWQWALPGKKVDRLRYASTREGAALQLARVVDGLRRAA